MSYQMTSMRAVRIEFNWSQRDRAFYINSQAGLIKFKPKTTVELTNFRDEHINRVDNLRRDELEGSDVTRRLFRLYKEIRKKEKVSYKANLHTRLKALFYAL